MSFSTKPQPKADEERREHAERTQTFLNDGGIVVLDEHANLDRPAIALKKDNDSK